MTAFEIAHRCFQKALEVKVDDDGRARIARQLPAADSRGVVYVAIRSDGQALKVGMTLGRLRTRWNGIVDTINGKRTRKHEVKAQGWWHEHTRGNSFEVWCKHPGELVIHLEDEPPRALHSFHLEEAYWDDVFHPLIGIKLSTRP
jgi:hypothetical protein